MDTHTFIHSHKQACMHAHTHMHTHTHTHACKHTHTLTLHTYHTHTHTHRLRHGTFVVCTTENRENRKVLSEELKDQKESACHWCHWERCMASGCTWRRWTQSPGRWRCIQLRCSTCTRWQKVSAAKSAAYSFTHLLIHSSTQSFNNSFTHLAIHSLTYLFMHSLTHSFIYLSLIHSFTHSFICPLLHTHSLTCFLTGMFCIQKTN